MKKKQSLTPLQAEAQRIEDEKRRRQEAVKAAQEYSLRGPLEKKRQAAKKTAGLTEEEPQPTLPDFDTVREALRDERHRESRKAGENPRYVSALDDGGVAREKDDTSLCFRLSSQRCAPLFSKRVATPRVRRHFNSSRARTGHVRARCVCVPKA
jgi:hypothetical protein